MPARTNGIQSISIIIRLAPTECVLLRFNKKTKMHQARPATVKIIPPIFSHFQATIRIESKINDGMRCIIKAVVFCKKERSGEKESSANRLTKRIVRMQRIRGNQCNTLMDVFILRKLNYAAIYTILRDVRFRSFLKSR